ncbi:PREDICTED: LOC109946410 [Prunus dulcis]|uniref:PREDICTED: LOC109946410 n=1 Tax=Prunus dulcis TaxID=3755 RepID=A0A5E4FXG5_PRUDU|nr:hypothetical protein L3X38_025612 [Prunus dulcis]VVA32241.1 PREDICTED: LOC109946410 [Prunus dulcis]
MSVLPITPQVLGIENARQNKVPKIQWEPITFYEDEEEEFIFPHDDPMIIQAEGANFYVGFSGDLVQLVGNVSLSLTLGTALHKTMIHD